jgi:hypothetical protein
LTVSATATAGLAAPEALGKRPETRTVERITARERLHRLVKELSQAEADAMLTRLAREREDVRQRALAENAEGIEDAWALTNAREAIRQEPW